MLDLLLLFPPQWSPFQPPLSIPSLSAWLRRAGYSVKSFDLNVDFYHWLLSDECTAVLSNSVEASERPNDLKRAFREILSHTEEFRADLDALIALRWRGDPGGKELVKRHYIAIKSLETYLSVVSDIGGTFSLSPYEFMLRRGNLNPDSFERMVESPPEVLRQFCQQSVDRLVRPSGARVIGLSCIGQEQVFFTLLLGSMIKSACDAFVVVGGTIFSRIFERGVLRPEWFGQFFDIIVRNEGERPCEKILQNVRANLPPTSDAPSVVYRAGDGLASSPSCAPLRPSELPLSDFDDMPLNRYLSAAVSLPVLSSRGCYWGKCEFCHHGMVYGEHYEAYAAESVVKTVEGLARKYGVSLFTFNDEALPPKIARRLGDVLPAHEDSGWAFSALIKFEKFYRSDDFEKLYRAGFRELYVGLESGSERVLTLMKKNNTRETMVRNLADITNSGICIHCFLFFGFPGETEENARETYEFVLDNAHIISSIGCGTFSLEHNAPISRHLEDFGLQLHRASSNDMDVYYDYDVTAGISAERAEEWKQMLENAATRVPHYRASGWMAREHQLIILARMSRREFVQHALDLCRSGSTPPACKLSEIVSLNEEACGSSIVVNRLTRRVLQLAGGHKDIVRFLVNSDIELRDVADVCPTVYQLFIDQPVGSFEKRQLPEQNDDYRSTN